MGRKMQTGTRSQRAAERTLVRTNILVFFRCHGANCREVGCTESTDYHIVRGWSDDISPIGLCLRTARRIPEKDVFVSILMPGLTGKVFLGELVREEQGENLRIQFSYGCAIRGICGDEQTHELLTLSAGVSSK